MSGRLVREVLEHAPHTLTRLEHANYTGCG